MLIARNIVFVTNLTDFQNSLTGILTSTICNKVMFKRGQRVSVRKSALKVYKGARYS